MRSLTAVALVLLAAATADAAVVRVTNLADSGTGSLRWAVDQTNHNSGADGIAFDISGTIHTTSPIMITEEVLIDGNDAVTIEANGASPAALIVAGPNTHLRALSVSNDGGAGIVVRGDWCWIDACHIGPNSGDGIRIENGTHNTITKSVVVGSQIGVNIEGGFWNEVFGSFIGRERERHERVGNRDDGIRADAQSSTVFVGGVRAFCTNNCADFVTPQNILADNGGAGIRIEGTLAHVIWNQIVDNGGDGIVHGANATRGEYVDNWLARNGGNGLTVVGLVDTILANDGNCNERMLLDIGGDGPTRSKNAPILDGAPPPPAITGAFRDQNGTSVLGTIDADPKTTYLVAFHTKVDLCPREGDDFDWNPETISVTTDESGKGSFAAVIGAHGEDSVSATMTAVGGKKMSEPSDEAMVQQTLFEATDVAVSTSLSSASAAGAVVLTFTTTVTNRGPAGARNVVLTLTPLPLAPAPPTDTAGATVNVGGLPAGSTFVLRQSFLWPFGSAPVRYQARVTHDDGIDLDPSNDAGGPLIYPTRRRAVR